MKDPIISVGEEILERKSLKAVKLSPPQVFDGAARGKVPLALPLLREQPGGSILLRRSAAKVGQNSTGVDNFYRNGLITCPMMYNEFSNDLENAYKNKDVIQLISDERKDDPAYWQGFLELGKQFDNRFHCQ